MRPEELNEEVENFVMCVNELISNEYKLRFPSLSIPKVNATENRKYYKLIRESSVWGFVSKVDGVLKGSPIKVGDLLMAANWKSPAKHSRGNILDGTATYGVYGPVYLK